MTRLTPFPAIACLALMSALLLPCKGKEAVAGGRVRLEYDDTLWQLRPATARGADVVQLVSDAGSFTVLRMPEKAIVGGMGSAESRRRFFEQLSKNFVRTEDIRTVTIAGKPGFEYFGKRTVGDIEYRMPTVLIVDAGDVLVLISNAFEKDPMSVPSIVSIWNLISIQP